MTTNSPRKGADEHHHELSPHFHSGAHNHLPHDAEPCKCSACQDLLSRSFAFPYLRKGKRPATPPKPYVAPIVYDATNPCLTSDDESHARMIVQEQSERIEKLTKEVTELQEKLSQAQTTNREVSSFLNGEILSKEQKTRKLQVQLDDRTQSAERNMHQLRAQMQQQLRDQKAEFDSIESQLRAEVAKLKDDNAQLLQFRAQQKQMDNLVSSLRSEIAGSKHDLERQDSEWSSRFESTKASLKSEYERALENAREDARIAARAGLSEEVLVRQRLKVQLATEHEDHEKAHQEWISEKEKLEQDRDSLRADKALISMQVQSHGQQLTAAHQHNADLFKACKLLKGKVEALLTELEDVQKACEKQQEGTRAKEQADVTECERVQKETEKVNSSIRQIRKLSQRILKCRSPVEVQLIEAIEACKEKLAKEQRQKKALEHQEWLRLVHNGATPRLAGALASKGAPQPAALRNDTSAVSARGPGSDTFMTSLAPDVSDAEPSGDTLALLEPQDVMPGVDFKGPKVSILGMPWREREKILRHLFKAVNDAHASDGFTGDPMQAKLDSLSIC